MSAKDEAGVLLNLQQLDKPELILEDYSNVGMALDKVWVYSHTYYNKYGLVPSRIVLVGEFPQLLEYEIDENIHYYLDKLEQGENR